MCKYKINNINEKKWKITSKIHKSVHSNMYLSLKPPAKIPNRCLYKNAYFYLNINVFNPLLTNSLVLNVNSFVLIILLLLISRIYIYFGYN